MFRVPQWMKIGGSVVVLGVALSGCSDEPDGEGAGPSNRSDRAVSEKAQAAVDEVTRAYLSIQSQLASDSVEQVPANLRAIREAAGSLKTAGAEANDENLAARGAELLKNADFVVKDAKQVREKFVALSGAVIELVRTHPPSDAAASDLYLAECPMVEDGLWLQTDEKIANPYMGSRMLQCGGIEKAIKETPPGSADASG